MLDPIGREEVLDTVRRLKDQGMATVISITHDLEEAARADRIIVMNGGRKYAEGTPEEIFKLNEDLVRIGLDLRSTSLILMSIAHSPALPESDGFSLKPVRFLSKAD